MAFANAPITPAKIEFRFFERNCRGTVTPANAIYQITVNAPTDVSPNQNTKIFNDWCAALWNGSTVSNSATLQSLCNTFAESYYDWITFRYAITYNGIIAPEVDGTMDCIEFDHTSSDIKSIVTSEPYNNACEELMHGDIADRQCTDANNAPSYFPTDKYPWREVYGPPAQCGGGGAKAHAVIDGGSVSEVIVDYGGVGYNTDSSTVVQFEDGDGTGATAHASVFGSSIASVIVDNGGTDYTVPPIVSFFSNSGPMLQITRYKELFRGGKQIQYFVSTDNI